MSRKERAKEKAAEKITKKKNIAFALNKFLVDFIYSILAGFMISIGCTIYLMTNQSLIGTALFSFGLIFILIQQYNLYTGRIGKIQWTFKNIPLIITIAVGNFIGTLVFSSALKFTRYSNILIERANLLYNIKSSDNFLSLFILAFACGIVMFLAVSSYDNKNRNFIPIIIAVMVFIICGFEHSIADMAYFNIAKNIFNFTQRDFLILLIILIGNSLGAKTTQKLEKIKNRIKI